MNERIKELAEQAGIVFWEISGDVDWRQANRENLEKFAELIVRECLEQARDEVQYQYDWKLANAVSKRVLEHFGVKQ